MKNQLNTVLETLEAQTEQSLERLFEILRIPSISTDPAFHQDCENAAQWCANMLNDIGFEAKVFPTQGKPMVVGHYSPDFEVSGPRILFYGHYDVQPADPLELWDTPPFDPHLLDHPEHGKIIVARGASDDKAQFLTFLEACRAWHYVHKSLPLHITVLLEGEEESGSPSLPEFLDTQKESLKADIALVCDTGQWDNKTPAITTMLRGMAFTEVTLTGPNRDLHSGIYGGPVMNPIRALTKILGNLCDDQGRIQIPHFYDDVAPLSDNQKTQWEALNFQDIAYLESVGLSVPAGETGYSALEQLWSRPTLEINGIYGGYTGPGNKTIIPSTASAKISFRLVADQDPHKILQNFQDFIRSQIPDDCSVSFQNSDGSPAVCFDQSSIYVKSAAKALEDEFGTPALMMGCGASIPIVESFQNVLSMDALLVGFALEDDCIHSPNEKYNLSSFISGQRSWARIIDAFTRIN
ncbi:MAG: M20/M25/M40 family metallo-hydrolase [Pseudomonadota bacterium]